MSEDRIQFCPNFCSNKTVIHNFCEEKEPRYVKAMSADVKSDRCCDKVKCRCVCHFECGTFRLKAKKLKKEGYQKCLMNRKKTKRDAVFARAKKWCKVGTLSVSRSFPFFPYISR